MDKPLDFREPLRLLLRYQNKVLLRVSVYSCWKSPLNNWGYLETEVLLHVYVITL